MDWGVIGVSGEQDKVVTDSDDNFLDVFCGEQENLRTSGPSGKFLCSTAVRTSAGAGVEKPSMDESRRLRASGVAGPTWAPASLAVTDNAS